MCLRKWKEKWTAKYKSLHGLDKYLIFSFTVLIVYTIVEQVLSAVTGTTHDTLTTCIFSCWGGECLLCAVIKRYKLKRGNDD